MGLKLLITYISKTGNIERFIRKLPYENIRKIITGTEKIEQDCIFITYTTGIGEVPIEADLFCQNNAQHIVGIISSGNRNWGSSYGIAADKLSNKYNIPVLMKFELSGKISDVEKFIERIEELEISRTK